MSNQDEYRRRIHRAQDFIEAHLDRPLSLEEIAERAAFSPYHFHRVYTAITGETLYQFMLRVRLEKAASTLVSRPDQSITAIALDTGFSSSATFARAFKAEFGVSATEYRNGKNCKTLRKDRKARAQGDSYVAGEDNNLETRSNVMKTIKAESIRVEDHPEKALAYLRHVGPYAGDEKLFERLWGQFCAWAGPRDLLGKPNAEMICIYHDDPEITEEAKLRMSLGVTVPVGTETSGDVNLLPLPAGKYVCARFELDPADYGAAWNTVMAEWLPESGYQPDDRPAYECYLNDPEQHPEGKHVVEIRLGVKPL